MKKSHKVKAPFCYFGGKSSVADLIWELIGNDVKRYFEPLLEVWLCYLLERESLINYIMK